MAPVGLIGLGRLGSAIAERLLAAGFSVLGCDIDPEACCRLEACGGETATAYEVALTSKVIVLSLPSHAAVESVLPFFRPLTIVIDTTNAEPEESEATAAALKKRGVAYLDAPVCEWHETVRAQGGKVVCGGDASAVSASRDIFAAFARPLIHAGPSGAGTRMKRSLEHSGT